MSRHEKVWNLLNRYRFQFDTDLFQELTCVICRNISINAHQNICGCRYCLKCIEPLLNESERYCPGATPECKEHPMKITCLRVDLVTNVKISKIPAKCPKSDCLFVDELRNLDDHIQSHITKCPYSGIGCDSQPDLDIEQHLDASRHVHSTLTIDTIQNLKMEVETLKKMSRKEDGVSATSQSVIDDLKRTVTEDRQSIKTLTSDLASVNDLATQWRNSLTNLAHEIQIMKASNEKKDVTIENISKKINKMISNKETKQTSLELKVETLGKMTENISAKVEENCRKISENKENIDKNADKIELHFQIVENCSESRLRLKEEPSTFSATAETVNNEGMRTEIEIGTITPEPAPEETGKSLKRARDTNLLKRKIKRNKVPALKVTFTWVVVEFSKERKFSVANCDWLMLSEPFYTGPDGTGYKMCLVVYPNGVASTNHMQLAVGFHLMQGEHDNELEWPLRSDVSIGLVDQWEGNITFVEIFNYRSTPDVYKNRWNRPVTCMNEARMSSMFIDFSKLLGKKRFYKNDSIVLQCIVA